MKKHKILTITCPEVSVTHDKKNAGLDVTVELPGVNKEDIDLTVTSGGFCIAASREDERYEGCFQFGHEVNSDKAKAKFANGSLFFNVPFRQPLCGKKIDIE